MKFASINDEFFTLCKQHHADEELLYNTNRRPYLIIVKLKYKGVIRPFALPFRSDISSNTPKSQYLSLPPRPTTKPGRRHGLHYIKLFPIDKQYLEVFKIDNDKYYQTIVNIIERKKNDIIAACQEHLNKYESEGAIMYAPNIDKIIAFLDNLQTNAEKQTTI